MACTVMAFKAPAVRAAPTAARSVKVCSDRSTWIPGMTAPPHLDGSMPGDFGFDPLGLGTQGEDRLKWCDYARSGLSPRENDSVRVIVCVSDVHVREHCTPQWLRFEVRGPSGLLKHLDRVLGCAMPAHLKMFMLVFQFGSRCSGSLCRWPRESSVDPQTPADYPPEYVGLFSTSVVRAFIIAFFAKWRQAASAVPGQGFGGRLPG